MFTIPNQVKIGGIVYNVVQVPEWPGSSDFDGELKIEGENTIYINSNLTQEAKEVTFIHECLHAMTSVLDHTALDLLAEGLYQILADNAF